MPAGRGRVKGQSLIYRSFECRVWEKTKEIAIFLLDWGFKICGRRNGSDKEKKQSTSDDNKVKCVCHFNTCSTDVNKVQVQL